MKKVTNYKIQRMYAALAMFILTMGGISQYAWAQEVDGADQSASGVIANASIEKLSEIKAFRKMSDQLYVGGQPTEDQFAELKSAGIATVIDLRNSNETKFDEASLVEQTGMAYINLPVDGAAGINDENRNLLRSVLYNATGVVFLHCGSSNRVGALLALDAVHNGMSVEDALEYGRT